MHRLLRSSLHRLRPLAGAALLALVGCSDLLPTDADRRLTPAPGGADVEAATDIGVFTGSIRIGVIPADSVVQVGGTGSFLVRDKASGAELFRGNDEQFAVRLGSGTVSRTSMRLQVACIFTADPPTDFLARAEGMGYVTYTTQITTSSGAKCWRVYLGDYPMDTSWSVREAFRQQAIADGLAPSDAFWPSTGVTVVEGVVRYDITHSGGTVSSDGPVVVEPLDGLVRIGAVRYRGRAEVALNSTGSLAGINELPMEQYLYGVVPRELGPVAYPELEALKAQAVAARTWALVGFRKRVADGYNLRATTDDQVYGGFDAEHALSTQAVDETAGMVATYEGRPISTFYSSTSGGHTASFEEWLDGAQPIPYLTGVPDAERGEAMDYVPSLEVFKSHSNPTSLRSAGEGDFEADWSQFHRWVFQWSDAEIRRVISAFAGRDVGRVLEINVLERGPSGRVLRIEYVTESGSYISTRNGIRSSLRYINASGNLANLRSTLFFIEPVRDAETGAVTGFKAYGGGWGHGVGMSQTGAVGMAERGATYEQILKHYYRGISLDRQY